MFHWRYFIVLGIGLCGVAVWTLQNTQVRRTVRKKILAGLLLFIGVAGLSAGGYLEWWYVVRSRAVHQELFPGVTHLRTILKHPRPIVVNLLFVDLKSPIEFAISNPGEETSPKLRAATVGNFLEHSGVQVAMNANFFHPFHSKSPWDFYPRAGDVVEVLGIAAASGNVYSTQVWAGATLYLSASNQLQLGGTVPQIWNAISGDQWLLRDGKVVAKTDSFGVYPRAAAGISAASDRLILAVVDGKQRGFSEGITLPELSQFLRSRGAYHAINLDGGGSVTLVARDENGRSVALNSPIHTRIPGRQRPVANHIGIR